MPDWQERITHGTSPALRAEHAMRYRLAAPLVAEAQTWCDLGCGNGVAAASVMAGRFEGRALLVDVAEQAVERAADEVRAATGATVDALAADLTDPATLERLRESLLGSPAPRVVTCFEVVEHLASFPPLIELLTELADNDEATVLLSVPNDAFFATENPHHLTTWGEGAFAELRRLLPEDAVVAHQLALTGSAVVPAPGDAPVTATVEVELRAAEAVPTHFLAVMGPRATDVGLHADVVQTDLDGQRAWEREREANLAFDEELVATWSTWFDEWRAYIHKLERRLGLPLSGVDPQELPSGEPAVAKAGDEPAS